MRLWFATARLPKFLAGRFAGMDLPADVSLAF